MTNPNPKIATPPAKKQREDEDRLTVTQVAIRLSIRYQRARDMMLSGKFGPAEYVNRSLTVSRDGLIEWEQKKHQEAR